MNKNRIKGRRGLGSWHHTANPFGSSMEVNTAVVQGSIERLPREASMVGIRWFQSTTKTNALVPAMVRGVSIEESAESIVVVSEPVSSFVPVAQNEECGQPVRSKARTRLMNSNHMRSKRRIKAVRLTLAGWLHVGKHVSSTSSLRVCSG